MSPFVGAGLVQFELPFPIPANLWISLHPLDLYVRLQLLWQMFPHLVRKLLHLLRLPHRERDCEGIGSQFIYLWYVSGFVVLPLQSVSVLSYIRKTWFDPTPL